MTGTPKVVPGLFILDVAGVPPLVGLLKVWVVLSNRTYRTLNALTRIVGVHTQAIVGKLGQKLDSYDRPVLIVLTASQHPSRLAEYSGFRHTGLKRFCCRYRLA